MKLNIRNWLKDKYPKKFSNNKLHQTITAEWYYRIITDSEVKKITIFDICILVEILELPLILAYAEIGRITHVTEGLLRSLSQKKALKRNEGTWLGFQIAYLRGLQQILEQEVNLQKPWINRAMYWGKENANDFLLVNSHFKELLTTLGTVYLTDTQAEDALSLVTNSSFVQQIDSAVRAWFIANGVQETEAKLIVQRIANGLNGHLLAVIAENALPLAQLQKFVQLAILPSGTNNAVANKIDLQRELYRASLLQHQAETLFIESFSLKDIYVPLKGLPIEPLSASKQKTFQSVDLMTWVLQELNNLDSVTVVESEAGYGKTSFCQILAAKLAQEFYPNLMPILIRLRDISYSEDLMTMLNSGFPIQLHDLNHCLEIEHPKVVLILDGLDELPFNRNHMGRAKFVQKLVQLQSHTQRKIILTSRSQELSIEDEMQLRRFAIQPFEQEELRIWFQNWAALQSVPIAQSFFTFLKQAGLFSTTSIPKLATLIRQPLMLYLLGILHRDGFFNGGILELAANQQTGNGALLWEIYQLFQQIHQTENLHAVRTIALSILHSQRHYIESNLLLSTCQLNTVDELETELLISPHPQVLPAFYFHCSTTNSKLLTKIEFSHARFGEFITAEAIVAKLKLLTQRQRNSYGEYIFHIDSVTSVAYYLYELLGFGIITEQIEALVISGLQQAKTQEFSFEQLCDRLLQFWYPYCQGRWLDEGIAHKTRDYLQTLHNYNNVEQINAAVGLNVFFLLSACHRQAKRSFLPCRNPSNLEEFQPDLLLILINRCAILEPQAFQKRINTQSFAVVNLSDTNLTQVILTQIDLEGINLSGANLSGANLAGVNLANANLTGANLSNANLSGANLALANLTGVNLTNANLTEAKFQSAILTNACLHNTILSEASKEVAKFQGAIFVLEEWVALKRLLLRYHRLGKAAASQLQQSRNSDTLHSTANTDIWLCNISQVGLIESIEGEVISEDLYEDEADDETVSF
jgi:uncharacterized protein YjbI with pentapeptide repeats